MQESESEMGVRTEDQFCSPSVCQQFQFAVPSSLSQFLRAAKWRQRTWNTNWRQGSGSRELEQGKLADRERSKLEMGNWGTERRSVLAKSQKGLQKDFTS